MSVGAAFWGATCGERANSLESLEPFDHGTSHMSPEQLRGVLEKLAQQEMTVEQALDRLEVLPFEDLGFARLDHHRQLRTGVPEIVYGPGKTTAQLCSIVAAVSAQKQLVLVTRVEPGPAQVVLDGLDPVLRECARYDPVSRLLSVGEKPKPRGRGTIAVVSAGTSDLPVAEEAAQAAEYLGNAVDRIFDVGVAGLHRTLAVRPRLEAAELVIVVAGMEGALPSVLKGLISKPVIAVPTSVGYGLHLNGLSALLGMLNTCTLGVTVVNIDAGFSAGYVASLFNQKSEGSRRHD